MPKVKNRLDQPLVVNLGPKTIRLGPKESRDITAKEKSARHLERLEKEGYIEFVSDDEVEKKKKKKKKGKKKGKKPK